ncbi:unnamed protein product [Protopolystoma xenopodis]|uniref:Uncharacterized protein n=1 Tax=Protopolystoma xenopodis TaxID=117903 RepID=A0A3S5C3T7_9PLAT|nr:unnamed protein product [Protopolystoma xenopodis]
MEVHPVGPPEEGEPAPRQQIRGSNRSNKFAFRPTLSRFHVGSSSINSGVGTDAYTWKFRLQSRRYRSGQNLLSERSMVTQASVPVPLVLLKYRRN